MSLEPKKFKRKGERTLYTRDNPDRTARTAKPKTSAPSPSKRKDSVAEILLMEHLDELRVGYERECRFHPERKWRFDFALRGSKSCTLSQMIPLAIEIEGGAWTQGRHTRGKGFEADIRKYNEAARLGWTVIRFTPNMIERGESKVFLAELFGRQS